MVIKQTIIHKRVKNTAATVLLLTALILAGIVSSMAQSGVSARKLATPNPSLEAQAVFRFLKDITGEKILSGQMAVPWGIDELKYIQDVTGKMPAIRGIDLIHEKDNEKEIQNAIAWWKAGGIPTIMWHWGAPSVGEGYENSKVAINTGQCFIKGTPENIAFEKELETKADHLEILKNNHVPVLWRPFHEFNGDWFWWSKEGPEMFKKLWIYMFDYFVKERKLDNLIWVLCYADTPDINWYPGDEYVDIVGADTYKDGTDPKLKMYEQIVEITGSPFLPVALHECGEIPDPEKCLKTGAMWTWWMLWHTTFLSNSDTKYLNYVYNHEQVITLDELPDLVKQYGENRFENIHPAGRLLPFEELKNYSLGKKTKQGGAFFRGDILEVTATGNDFWFDNDEGFFVFQQMAGDFDISVQVVGLEPVHLYTKAGLMAREDLSSGSRNVFFHIFPDNQERTNNNGGCQFQFRDRKNGNTQPVFPDNDLAGDDYRVDFPETWIRLTRTGNFFRSYISHDNKTWHLYAKHFQQMPEKMLVGVAVTSHDPVDFTKAGFSKLQLTW